MHHRPFGTTGLSVAPLGIGCPGGGRTEEEIVSATNELLDAGCNLVDTAQIYGNHEDILGRRLAHRRHEMILVSKCGHHEVLPDGSMRSLPISMADIDQALQRLRCEYLDAMLLHSYDYEPLLHGEAIAVLNAAKQAGKIRYAGYSGDNERAAWAAQCPDLDIVELSANIADQHNIDAVLPQAQANGKGVIVKRPLANAAWLRERGRDQVHESVFLYTDRLQELAYQPNDYGCQDMDELALRFSLSIPGAHCLIASAGSARHRERNLSLAAAGPLEPAAYASLRAHWQQHCRPEWTGVN